MQEKLVQIRNYILSKIYKWILKPIFFQFDPENIHDKISAFLLFLGKYSLTREIARFCFGYSHPMLEQTVLGIKFKNPVGLSAGFDKNALLIDSMKSIGFGFTEVGSITGEVCEGNPKPRLWRLKESKSLVIYYGLKNDGAEAIAKRLADKKFSVPVGISIAKTNCKDTAETEPAIADYFKAYREFENIGDYVTVNISCPNAFGGQPFTDVVKLNALMAKILSVPKTKPIFLKISPDLTTKEVDDIIYVANKYSLDGFVCTNLTKNRDNKNIKEKEVPEKGGISGKALQGLSDDLIRYVYKKTEGKFIIIGVGGISTAEDAYKKIKAGATLLELITGMIYEGPQTISSINLGLALLLKKDGYKNISEAVGKE